NAYLNKKEIQSFIEDSNLKLTREQLEEKIKLYELEQSLPQEQKVKTLYKPALDKYSAQLSLQTTSREKQDVNTTIQSNALTLVKEIRAKFSERISNRKRLIIEQTANEAKRISWKINLELPLKSGNEIF